MNPSPNQLTASEIGTIMGQLDRLVWLDLTGGEIFTRKDVEDIFSAVLENARALRLLHFPTNGWFTDRTVRLAKDIAQKHPDRGLIITVSIDGPQAIHDGIRGRNGSFARALDTWTRLREIAGLDVYVGTTVTSSNIGHLQALEERLTEAVPDFTGDEWHCNWMQESEHFFGNQDIEGPTRVATDNVVATHLRRRGLPRHPTALMELGFLANLEFYLAGEPTGIPCQSLRSTCFISEEGDVYPCHVWNRPLGNLREQDIQTLWDSQAVRTARDEVKRLECGGCFTPCEAYPALAGSPIRTSARTAWRLIRLATNRTLGG